MNGLLAAVVFGLPPLVWLLAVIWIWRRAARVGKRRRAAGQLLAAHAAGLLIFTAAVLTRRSPEQTPLLDTRDKVQLQRNIRVDRQSGLHLVRLDGPLLARGLRTAASLAGWEVHSRFQFQSDEVVESHIVLRLPAGFYLPLSIAGSPRMVDGDLTLQVDRLRLGRLPVPRPLANLLVAAALDAARLLPVTSDALAALEDIEVSAGQLLVKARQDSDVIDESLVLFEEGDAGGRGEAAAEAIRSWLQLPRGEGEPWFADSIRHLFQAVLASQPQWPPERQNAAAILAAGVALGEPKLAAFTLVPLSAAELQAAGRHAAGATVHTRRDLVQHFVLSAAIAEVASEQISGFLGISKEEVDSGAGGSGFSFADLAADRAGIAFQQRACDEDTATAIQTWLAGQWKAEQLVPLSDGLPERLDEDSFAKRFGDTEDPRFRAALEQIDTRIEEAPWN